MLALRKVNPDHFVEEMANEDVGTCLVQFACLSMAIVRQGEHMLTGRTMQQMRHVQAAVRKKSTADVPKKNNRRKFRSQTSDNMDR